MTMKSITVFCDSSNGFKAAK